MPGPADFSPEPELSAPSLEPYPQLIGIATGDESFKSMKSIEPGCPVVRERIDPLDSTDFGQPERISDKLEAILVTAFVAANPVRSKDLNAADCMIFVNSAEFPATSGGRQP